MRKKVIPVSVAEIMQRHYWVKVRGHFWSLGLTDREADVALLVCYLKNWQVAEMLKITIETVNKHLDSIYETLQVTGRTQLVLRVVEYGFVGQFQEPLDTSPELMGRVLGGAYAEVLWENVQKEEGKVRRIQTVQHGKMFALRVLSA